MTVSKELETEGEVTYDRQLFYADVDIGGLADGLKFYLTGNPLF